ncbi:hypothetical protein E4K67_20295 [Desulfosporosinus fructosivorans]|uniref:Uncharacterized protein n=1 Tax=Desulfosporosinus fructosivorans TaxID=2018669 RepID=A0A4Z0QZR5_9FIRM|nr:hypothetical protein [Desulfosporosinus fructosivorans]TGE36282.1 hypothetical protein E4K67_20295 [Desulfosporosinus fructosivorans]
MEKESGSKLDTLIDEIIRINETFHSYEPRIKEIGMNYPKLMFYDDFDNSKYLTEKDVINYLCIKWKLRNDYNGKLSELGLRGIFEAVEHWDSEKLISRVYDKEYGVFGFLNAISIGKGSVEAFIEYLYSDYEMDDDCNLIDEVD